MSEQLSLRKLFDTLPPRERSGSVSSDRSQYQKDWALCKLLKLHLDSSDYLVAFDMHDDVIIFEPEDEPLTVCFYQVKTKEKGDWTLTRLIQRYKGKNGPLPSMLGNLYHNLTLFKLFTKRLTLVSNAPFKIALSKDGKKAEVLTDLETPFVKLPPANRTKIKSSLRAEHKLDAEPVLDDLVWFERSDLPLIGHDIFAKGKLADFFSHTDSSAKYNIPLIYTALVDEIRRRNDYSKDKLEFEEMRTKKAIGKSEFSEIIKVVAVNDSCERAWQQASDALTAEGVEFGARQSMKRAWQLVEAQRLDWSSAPFRKLAAFAIQLQPIEHSRLSDTLNYYLGILKAEFAKELTFDDDFLRAVLLMRLFGVL